MSGKNTFKSSLNILAKNVNPIDLINSVNTLAKDYFESEKFRESQITERNKIESDRQIALSKIEATKQIFLDYLNKSFDERSINFSNYFKNLEVAIKNGDIQQVSLILNGINQLAESSPFKDIVDSIKLKNALDSKSELDI